MARQAIWSNAPAQQLRPSWYIDTASIAASKAEGAAGNNEMILNTFSFSIVLRLRLRLSLHDRPLHDRPLPTEISSLSLHIFTNSTIKTIRFFGRKSLPSPSLQFNLLAKFGQQQTHRGHQSQSQQGASDSGHFNTAQSCKRGPSVCSRYIYTRSAAS